MTPRKTFFDPSEGRSIRLADLVDLSCENREDTAVINDSIAKLSSEGGGTLYLSDGIYKTRTIHLKSNVTIYIDKSAVLQAAPGEFAHEDLTDPATGQLYPWALLQDAGHTWYLNSLFYGDHVENIKIIGNGMIDGNGFITKYDNKTQEAGLVPMNNSSGTKSMEAEDIPVPEADSKGRTCNKMFALKCCRHVEIGGICPSKDLWYSGEFDGKRGKVGYLNADGTFDFDSVGQMLHMTNTGHFAILASGNDDMHIHDIYLDNNPDMRDTFNLMSCRDIVVCNIYIDGCSDDVIKFSSDYSMNGTTRPSGNAIVRNIIGDTGCSLLLAGEESADDISNVCFDNAVCLSASRSGFLVWSRERSNIRNIHLNCGGSVGRCSCGVDHGSLSIGYTPAKVHPYRSHFTHMRMPFYIAVGGEKDTIPTGSVSNIYISKVTCDHIFAGSGAKACKVKEFADYDHQLEASTVIGGCVATDDKMRKENPARGRVQNVIIEDVDILAKGGHPASERLCTVDASQPYVQLIKANNPDGSSTVGSYGFYIHRADGVHFRNCTIATERYDGREPVLAEDSTDVTIENTSVYNPVS